MRDFVFENKTKVYFGKDQLQYLHEEIGRFGKRYCWFMICPPKLDTFGGAYFYEKNKKEAEKILVRIQNKCYNGYARKPHGL